MVLINVLAAISLVQGQDKTLDNAERMLNLATATQPLVVFDIVNAPPKEVWKAYATSEGIKSWMVAEGTIDLRIGGLMRTSYTKGSDLKGPDVIENKIISFDPERMLALQCVRTPNNFPFKKAILDVWTVLYFDAVGSGKTKSDLPNNWLRRYPGIYQLATFLYARQQDGNGRTRQTFRQEVMTTDRGEDD